MAAQLQRKAGVLPATVDALDRGCKRTKSL
jgi:hypothetical protein